MSHLSKLHPRRRVGACTLAALAALGCAGGPAAPPPSPTGAIHSSFPVAGRPYGIAVVRGRAEVARLDADSVSSLDVGSGVTSLGAFAVAGTPTNVAVSPDGALVIVSSQYADVTLHQAATGALVHRFTLPGSPFRVIASNDGTHAYATTNAGHVVSIDLRTSQAGTALQTNMGALNGVALSRDDGTLYVSSVYGNVAAISTQTLAVTRTYQLLGQLQDLALSPDGKDLFVADENGRVIDLTLATGTSRHVDVPAAFGLALTLDGTQLWITQPAVGQITVLDRTTLDVIRTLDLDGALGVPRRIVFDASGAAVVTDESGFVHVIR